MKEELESLRQEVRELISTLPMSDPRVLSRVTSLVGLIENMTKKQRETVFAATRSEDGISLTLWSEDGNAVNRTISDAMAFRMALEILGAIE